MSTVAVLLGLAVLAGAGPATVRMRAGGHRPDDRSARTFPPDADPLWLASSLDVMRLCLAAGMTVPDAAAVTARSAPPQLAVALRRGADLLALGATPDYAWSVPSNRRHHPVDPPVDALLRLARRSGAAGTSLASGVAELATEYRHEAARAAAAAAERAGVLIAGPLGLCFLPAFVCLGIAPVVAGLVGDVLGSGLW